MRKKQILTAFAAMFVVLSPGLALAQDDDRNVGVQDRARPEYDPLGLRFGGFDFNASLEAGVASTDNVRATEVNPQDDIVFSVSPNATLSSHWSRHALVISAGGEFTSHQDFSDDDAQSARIDAYGRLDIGPQSSINANLRAAHETEPRTTLDEAGATELVEFDRTEASIGAQHTINRVRLIGNLSTVEYDFDNPAGAAFDQNFRDRTQSQASARVEVAISPRVAIIGQFTADEREYDLAAVPSLNSEGQTIVGGVRVDLSNLIRGEVTVGQVERDYEAGETVDSVAVSADLEWFITPLTTISFTAQQEVEETGGTILAPYVSTRAGIRVDHELLRNLILSGGVSTAQREYEPPVSREDDGLFADFEARYLMNRRLSLRAAYVYEENDSTAPLRSYEVNTFFVGATLRL